MLEKYIESERKRYIIKRSIQIIPVIILATFIAFTFMRMGTSPAERHLGRHATDEAIQAFNERHGLDRPLHMQYIDWVSDLFRGDLGESIRYGSPVSSLVIQRGGVTVQLMGLMLLIAISLGVLTGVIGALHHNTWIDYLCTFQSLVWISTPDFLLAIIFIFIFALTLGWFPGSGYRGIEYLILPALAMGLRFQAMIARITRSSMLNVLNQDYINVAKTKGLKRSIVIIKHALRNALIPVVTVIALHIPMIFGGAMVTEQVFNIAGMGRLILEGVLAGDFVLIQSLVLIITIIAVVANLLADISYSYLDPRVSLEEAREGRKKEGA